MARRNRRRRANDRRRKMKPHESEPELGSDDQSELSREDSNPLLDTHKAQVSQLQNMHSRIEIKVESPNSNANALSQSKGKVNTLSHGPYLYEAAIRGDWKAAVTALNFENNIVRAEITERGDRALHIAAAAEQTAFVHNLVKVLDSSDLALQNQHGETAFYIAAQSGVVEMARVMYERNSDLPTIRSEMGRTPFEMAILVGNREMVEYLYQITPLEDLNAEKYMEILEATIHIDMYGIALMLLSKANKRILESSITSKGNVLKVLAQKPLSHGQRIQGRLWERLVSILATIPYIPWIYTSLEMRRQASQLVKKLWEHILELPDSDILKLIQDTQMYHNGAKIGNVEFLTLLSRAYPGLTWKFDKRSHSIFHVAVINRQEKVFSLIYHTGVLKNVITLYRDNKGNNILHLAGKLAPPSRLNIVSGPVLQMQRELLWFKEVEKIVRPSDIQMKNKKGITPRELFTAEHEKLREDGEVWMKDTASSCMVVATLIATVTFAAAFTTPGGNKEQTGTPIFLNNWWFTVFVISNAVAMFNSTASTVMFLSILTSRYREDDFLFSLPAKLMGGLVTLFASIVCMVLTFSATFFLVYEEEKQGTLPKLVAALALLPITLYAVLNCRLWITLIHSTCWASRFMFRQSKHKLF